MVITNREAFLKKHQLPPTTSLSMEDMSALSGFPTEALQMVYNRGIGAHSNLGSVRLKKDFSKNPDTKKYPSSARLSKERWATARVYAFLQKTPKVFGTADKDIAEKFNLE